ncbi:hypothetical protein, partial [Escherichia coli]|uniref:hypothetical protein n=3 Tax=Enterobacterales TaxID=91347 RepID=UPI00201A72CA
TGGTADRNRSHWSTSKTPSYTKSVSWQHHQAMSVYNYLKLNGTMKKRGQSLALSISCTDKSS